MKSAGGFQGLFIGSLHGTNFAAGGRGGRADGRGGGRAPAAPQFRLCLRGARQRNTV